MATSAPHRVGLVERLAVLLVQATWGRRLARQALALQLQALGEPPPRWFETRKALIQRVELARRGW